MQQNVPDVLIVRYGELALKSPSVRRNYESILLHNIRSRLKYDRVSFSSIQKEAGRIFIKTNDLLAITSVSKVFGIVSVSFARSCASDIFSI